MSRFVSLVYHCFFFLFFFGLFPRSSISYSIAVASMRSILSLLSLAPLALAAPLLESRQGCPSGVHIIAARGSTEAPGEGKLQELSDDIGAQIPGSTNEAVIYPATLLPYESSEETGVTDMTQLITNFVAKCPSAQIILTGFSQGAQIVGDVLGGGSFTGTAPLPEQYRQNSKFSFPTPLENHITG